MNTYKLEVLGLEVTVNDRIHYTDLGYVRNRYDTLVDICLRHNEDVPHYDKDSHGFTLKIDGMDGHRYIYTYYRRLLLPQANIRIRAHEETHVLYHLGQLSLLDKEIQREFGVGITLSTLPSEKQAEIGALYALHKHRISSFVRWLTSLYSPDLNAAVTPIYRLLRQNKRATSPFHRVIV